MKKFKLRDDLRNDSGQIFLIVEDVFGRPSQLSFGDGFRAASWEIHHLQISAELSLEHHPPSDVLISRMTFELADRTELEYRSAMLLFEPSWWHELWDGFASRVAKPWSDWTEDEIMENPSWCRHFIESGGVPTDRIHAMMVMKSYEIPEDLDVKGYFQAWQRRKQPAIP